MRLDCKLITNTKADKIGTSQIHKALKNISVKTGIILNQIIPVSSEKRTGKEEILARIDEMLQAENE